MRRIAADFTAGLLRRYLDAPCGRILRSPDDNEHFTPLATVGNDISVEFKQDCYRGVRLERARPRRVTSA